MYVAPSVPGCPFRHQAGAKAASPGYCAERRGIDRKFNDKKSAQAAWRPGHFMLIEEALESVVHASHVRTQCLEAFLYLLVAAIDVVHAVDFGLTFGNETCQYQGR
jgi:hypothetical protein